MCCYSTVIKKYCRWRLNDCFLALLSVFQGLLKMKLLPRLRYILEVVRPSPRVVQDVLEILTRIARHSSSSATQVVTLPVTLSSHYIQTNDFLLYHALQYNSSLVSIFDTKNVFHPGAWLSSLDGDVAVRVPSHFLDSAIFDSSSVCLWTPAGQSHEAVESIGYLWPTCLCQTGKCFHK